MAFARVQGKGGSATTQNLTVTLDAATTINNVVIAGVSISATQTSDSITDTGSQVYALAIGPFGVTNEVNLWYGVQTGGGVTAITSNTGASTLQAVVVEEFSGGATSNAAIIGLTSSGTADASTSASVTSFTPTTGSLVAAFIRTTVVPNFSVTAPIVLGATTSRTGMVHRLSASGAETMPATLDSGNWREVAAEFKVATTAYTLPITTGSYAITGNAIGLKAAFTMGLTAGAYAITGNAIDLVVVVVPTGGTGQYSGFFPVPDYIRRRQRIREGSAVLVQDLGHLLRAVGVTFAPQIIPRIKVIRVVTGVAALYMPITHGMLATGETIPFDELEMNDLIFLGVL